MWFDFYTGYNVIKHRLGLETLVVGAVVALWQDGHQYQLNLEHQPVLGNHLKDVRLGN
jgi:hypothetical protein